MKHSSNSLSKDVDFRQWLVFFLNNVHKYDDDLKRDLAELLPYSLKNVSQHGIRVYLKRLRTDGKILRLHQSSWKIL